MSPYREGRISAQDGLRLYYRDYGPRYGTSTPVVCLGGLTRNSADFDTVAMRLASHRRVICPDYIGRGRSDRAADWRRYAPPAVLYDLSTMLTALGIDGVVVVGTSLGGLLAAGMAAIRPTLVRAVVLNDIGPDIAADGIGRIRDYIGRDRPHRDWDSAVRDLQGMMPNLSVPGGDQAGWRRIAEATWRPGEDGLLHYDFDVRLARTMEQTGTVPDLWLLFKGLRGLPVAVVRGEQSDILSKDTLARMVEMHPDLTTATVPGVGHAPNLDEPEARAVIDDLLNRV